jgi:hypothetical protein
MILPSPAEARDAMLRVDHVRDPEHVIADLRDVARNLVREVESWSGEPNRAALVTAETTTEGVRRLLGALRIAISARSQRNAA